MGKLNAISLLWTVMWKFTFSCVECNTTQKTIFPAFLKQAWSFSHLDAPVIWTLWIFNAHVADSVASSSSLTVFCTPQWGLREKRTSWTISQRSCEHRTQAPCQDSTAGFWLSDKNCVRDCATLSSYLLSLVFTLSRPLLAPDKYCKHLCISVP